MPKGGLEPPNPCGHMTLNPRGGEEPPLSFSATSTYLFDLSHASRAPRSHHPLQQLQETLPDQPGFEASWLKLAQGVRARATRRRLPIFTQITGSESLRRSCTGPPTWTPAVSRGAGGWNTSFAAGPAPLTGRLRSFSHPTDSGGIAGTPLGAFLAVAAAHTDRRGDGQRGLC